MAYCDQAAVDAAFADLDTLLHRDEEPTGCPGCGSDRIVRSANCGSGIHYCNVCDECGAVQTRSYGIVDSCYYGGRHATSNYKRIHHWHERISQLMRCESQIPDDKFVQIAERLCDGTYPVINKDVIRQVLRSLNMQLYIEKWLQIIQRVTLITPPTPGGRLLAKLDEMFQELQVPFEHFKANSRKNFLNYNYIFCRLFQQIGCPQFCMFFPLIKSRQKLKALDQTWEQMMNYLNWPTQPLVLVPSFAVKLEQPQHQLSRIRQTIDAATQAVNCSKPTGKAFRKSDLLLLRELDPQTKRGPHRLSLPGPAPRKSASKRVPPPYASAAELRSLRRSQFLRPPALHSLG